MDPADHDANRRLTANIETIRRGVESRAAEIRRRLEQWLAESVTPADNAAAAFPSETAIDGYLAVHGEADARDLIEQEFPSGREHAEASCNDFRRRRKCPDRGRL